MFKKLIALLLMTPLLLLPFTVSAKDNYIEFYIGSNDDIDSYELSHNRDLNRVTIINGVYNGQRLELTGGTHTLGSEKDSYWQDLYVIDPAFIEINEDEKSELGLTKVRIMNLMDKNGDPVYIVGESGKGFFGTIITWILTLFKWVIYVTTVLATVLATVFVINKINKKKVGI